MARKKDSRQVGARAERKAQQHAPEKEPGPVENCDGFEPHAGFQSRIQRRANRLTRGKNFNSDAYLQPGDEHFISFKNQLSCLGLMLRDIPGDGNCLFRALGDQLEGHGRNHFQHRMNTVRFMIKHRKDFEPFIDENQSFEAYADNLSRLGTYAGQDALVAFARSYKVNIVIHQLNSPIWQIEGGDFEARELHLSYHNGEHYSSVRRFGDSTETAANVRITLPKTLHTQSTSNKKKSASPPLAGAQASAPIRLPQMAPPPASVPHARFGPLAFADSATEDDIDSGTEFLTSAQSSSSLLTTSPAGVGAPGSDCGRIGPDENGVCSVVRSQQDIVNYVINSTACTDEILVQETLEEYNWNSELAIDFLIQMMVLSAKDNEPAEPVFDPVNEQLDAANHKSEEIKKVPEKVTSKSKHLSNRERKELHRREKSERKRDRQQEQRTLEEQQTDELTATVSYLNL